MPSNSCISPQTGDEDLVIDVVVSHPGTLYDPVRVTQVYGPEDDWGAA
ncbi:MAG: hypothetical protein P8X58_06790 [Syntrophobacterales bacterium]